MKVYYDSNGDGTPNQEFSNIVTYPECQAILDIVGFCIVVVRDFQGALYTTFESLNFEVCKVEDDSSNILFKGFIVKKHYEHHETTFYMRGIGAVLEWTPFTNTYILATGLLADAPAGAIITCKDEDVGDPMGWAVDQWHTGEQDKGFLIVDNTNATLSKTWVSTGIVVAGHDNQAGNNASITTQDDADILEIREDSLTFNASVICTMTGAVIPDTNFIQRIEIDYKFGSRHDCNDDYAEMGSRVSLQVDRNGTYVNKRNFDKYTQGTFDNTFSMAESPTIVIEGTHAELINYLDDDGAGNYDALKGLKFLAGGSQVEPAPGFHYMRIDFVEVRVYYNSQNISPIMKQITDNAASTITCNGIANWTTTGVAINDKFYIGENTGKIISDLGAKMSLTFDIQTTFTKYLARWFRGCNGLEVLQEICSLEGCHWVEDYTNDQIIILAPGDFPASGITLDASDYEWDWIFEDDCNNYYRVEVYGCASLLINAAAEDLTVDSPMVKQIIDESIMTNADAQEVADTQLALLKDKMVSIQIPLNGVNSALLVGTTVNLTMARPTVGAANYKIRMITRSKRGKAGIMTTVYCGLGHSKIEEQIGMSIKKSLYLSHKAHTDRLISTPIGAGAAITWTDIGGRVAGVEAIITAEIVNGQSIDNAIDTLISTYSTTQHNRDIFPTLVVARNGVTAGANNVYRSVLYMVHGTNSKTSGNASYWHFTLPDDYVDGQNITIVLHYIIGAGTATVNYAWFHQYLLDGEAVANASTPVGAYTSDAHANHLNIEDSTITGTNLVAGCHMQILLRIEDNAAAQNINVIGIKLEVPVNTRD